MKRLVMGTLTAALIAGNVPVYESEVKAEEINIVSVQELESLGEAEPASEPEQPQEPESAQEPEQPQEPEPTQEPVPTS